MNSAILNSTLRTLNLAGIHRFIVYLDTELSYTQLYPENTEPSRYSKILSTPGYLNSAILNFTLRTLNLVGIHRFIVYLDSELSYTQLYPENTEPSRYT